MSNTIDYGPSSLQVYPQVSMTSGLESLTVSGSLDSSISSLEYKITLMSDSSDVVAWTDVASYSTTGLSWSAEITNIPIGPSGTNKDDWYNLSIRFGVVGGAKDTVDLTNPWGVGLLIWGIGQSNMHFWGPDAELPSTILTGVVGGDGVGLVNTSGISCLSAVRPLLGSEPEWCVPDGSGCSYLTSGLHEFYERPVGFVQAANGGSPIFKDHDTPLSYQAGRSGTGKWGAWLNENEPLWQDLVACYKSAGKPHFVITHQGESDTGTFAVPVRVTKMEWYKAGFELLIQKIRDLVEDETLEFGIGQLPGYKTPQAIDWLSLGESYPNIQLAQDLICKEDPHCHLVQTHDLSRTGDIYHLAPQGFADFALRSIEIFKTINNQGTGYIGPRITGITYNDASSFYVDVTHTYPATGWEQPNGTVLSGFDVFDSFNIGRGEYNVVGSATIYDSNTIKVELIRDLSGAAKFGYGVWGCMIPFDPITWSYDETKVPKDDQGFPLQLMCDWVPLFPNGPNVQDYGGEGDAPFEIGTYADILFNPHDAGSTLVKDAINLFVSSNTFYTNIEPAGPLYKFLKALSWSIYDINELMEDIGKLMDIERCPKEFFVYIAKLLGWHLISNDIESWRAQLRQAIYIYKSKGTRRSLEAALALIFPNADFNPTERVTELWESYIPNLLYYVIRTESPYHLSGWTGEDSKDLDIPFSNSNPEWNARYCVDYILARIQERNPGFINSIPNFEFGETLFEYRGRSDNIIPPFEKERYYSTKYVWPEHISYINYFLSAPIEEKGLGVPVSAVNAVWDHFQEARDSGLLQNSNQKWKFFTSSMELPFNYDKVMTDPEARFSNDVHYWSGKSSSVLLELSTGDFNFDLDQLTTNSKYAVEAIADILKDFKPFHVVFEYILYHDLEDSLTVEDLFLGWNIKFDFCELNTSKVLSNYSTSAFAMVSGTGTVLRGKNNGLPDSSYDNSSLYVPQISTVSRKSIRRKNRKFTNKWCKVYHRDGFSMPLPQDYIGVSGTYGSLNGPISATGFIPKGYNPSSGEYFSPVSSHGDIYKPNFASNDTVSGIPLSACYPCRGLTGIDSIKVETRSGLTPFQAAIINAMQRKADYELQESILSADPEFKGYFPRGNPWESGITLEELFKSAEFGRELNKIYNTDYIYVFEGKLYREGYDTRVKGGRNLESHVMGPILFNGNLYKPGEETSSEQKGTVYAGKQAFGKSYVTSQGSNVIITSTSLSSNNEPLGILSASYNIEGNIPRIEGRNFISGVSLGIGLKSESFFVQNNQSLSSHSVDTPEYSWDRSISVFNNDSVNSEDLPYIQFKVGGSESLDRGIYPINYFLSADASITGVIGSVLDGVFYPESYDSWASSMSEFQEIGAEFAIDVSEFPILLSISHADTKGTPQIKLDASGGGSVNITVDIGAP